MKQETSSESNVDQKEENPFRFGANIFKTLIICTAVALVSALPFVNEKEQSSLEDNVEARIYQVVENIDSQLIEKGGMFTKDPSRAFAEEVDSLSLTSNTPRVNEVTMLVNSVDDNDYTITATFPKYAYKASKDSISIRKDIASIKYDSQTGSLTKNDEAK